MLNIISFVLGMKKIEKKSTVIEFILQWEKTDNKQNIHFQMVTSALEKIKRRAQDVPDVCVLVDGGWFEI